MNDKKQLILGSVIALLISLALFGCSSLPDKKQVVKLGGLSRQALSKYKLVFVYVHGFGEGGKAEIPFPRELNNFLTANQVNAKVITYKWDNRKLDYVGIVPQWLKTRDKADAAGKLFSQEILVPLEAAGVPYYLIGYSLGSRVIAESLKCGNDKLKNLRGIYFLGSALKHDYRIATKNIPPGLKINNYYSPLFDQVLKTSFHVIEGSKAAGEIGFDDEVRIDNYRTVCTHAYKGGPLQRDYSDLAPALAYLALFNENILLKGKPVSFNIEMPVMKGTVNWNDIVRFKCKNGIMLVQHNANTNWFRAVYIDKNGKRKRKAWASNMHSLLEKLFPTKD
jgi:hypothetical protein